MSVVPSPADGPADGPVDRPIDDAPAQRIDDAPAHSGRRMAEDATTAFAVQILGYVTGLVASVLIARALGAVDRGIYAVAVTAASIAVVAFHAGIELASNYFFAERGTPLAALSRNGFLGAAILGPLGMVAMLVFFAIAHASVLDGLSLVLYLCAVATVPLQMHQLWLANMLMVAGRFRAYQRVSAVIAVLQLLAVCVLYAASSLDLATTLVLYLGVAVVAWALSLRASRPVGPIGPPYDLQLFRATLRYGLRLHGGYIGWFVLLRLDLFLVAWWLGPREAGVYAIAVLFAELSWQLTSPLVLAATRPQMALPSGEAAQVSFQVVRANLLLASVMAVAFVATLWFALPLLYGDEFDGAYAATVVLLPGVVAMAAFRPLYNWLVRVAGPLRLSAMCLLAAAVNVGINALLLRSLGIVGASLASSVSYALLTLAAASWAARASGSPLRTVVPGIADVRTIARNLGLMARSLRARIAARRAGSGEGEPPAREGDPPAPDMG
ncbi:MAG: oligosaccharide flippase family protein [Patulibacter sp.]